MPFPEWNDCASCSAGSYDPHHAACVTHVDQHAIKQVHPWDLRAEHPILRLVRL